MNSILKLVVPCRVVRQIQQSILGSFPKTPDLIPTRVLCVSGKRMAQRSITSFFKVSPPKPVVKEEKVEEKDIKVNGDKVDSPVKNGKTKPATKRPRLESSESDTSPKKKTEKSPAVSSDKKKKIKRQRIESSDSEADVSPKSESPILEEKIPASPSPEHKTTASPSPSPEKKPVIKVEKTKSPKTYASPKSKQKKPLTEVNSIKKSPSPKKIKKEIVEDSKKVIKKQEKVVKSEHKSCEKEKEVKSEAKDLVPEADYNPAKAKYHPIEDACWRAGQEVPYLALARTLELIEGTSARLKMVEILANYLRSVIVLTPEDLLPSVYMCLNQLAPSYESLELGIAETYLMKAIGQCTGRTLAQVRSAAQKCGDLGQVAEQARATQRTMFAPPPLTMRKVFAALKEIANMTGTASVNKKINKIQSLYVACRHSEARYLIRSLEGKLRIGLAEQSVLQALAQATAATPPAPAGATLLDASKTMAPEKFKARVDEHSLIIKTTYCECPSYDRIIPVLLQHGVAALPQHCRLTPGVPLKPMLAHPTKQVTHVFDRFEKEQFTCEWKYDGERAQIHVPGTDKPDFEHAAIFSRNQENNTSKYPDILRRLPTLLKDSVTSCVLDCEAVAYDTTTKQILPFQILSTRKRKDANLGDIKVQVCVFVFDLLFLNGQPLVRRPLLERRAALREHLNEREGEWQFATSKDCSTVEEVEQFMEEAMRGSCEGLMVKALSGDHARYDIARRSHNWLKLKKDYLEGVGDTLDVVVLGAYRGRGKRAGLYGGFLLACYDPTAEEFQALCKIGTGFSDESLQNFTEMLKEHVIDAPRNYYRYDASHAPDVWFSARCVWEVRCADLSLSPAHRAAIGLVHSDKGISLRFPRFVRVRADKSPEQATSAQQVADLYLAQDSVRNSAAAAAAATNIDDFY